MARRNSGVVEAERIEFRIGIHQGDIVIESGDILGDGVNVAARLEGLAEPGGICVSARVQEDVAGKLDLIFDDLGEQALKNIARPIRVFRIRLRVVASPFIAITTGNTLAWTLPDKPSIAVLPFTNMSNDPEQEYFGDGIAEDIITALSHYPSLFVIARNSSFTYKGRAVSVREVGRDLGVRYVLEGSLRKIGQSGPSDGSIGGGRNWKSCLGRALRPRSSGHFRCAGRDNGRGHGCDCTGYSRSGAAACSAQAAWESRCLGSIPARSLASRQGYGRRFRSRPGIVRAGDLGRPNIRRLLYRACVGEASSVGHLSVT